MDLMEILSTSCREISLKNTWDKLEQNLEIIGVTRVADITGLDSVGIPVYQAVRPNTTYPVSVFAGKGTSACEAKVSACMEALESCVTENYTPKMVSGYFEEFKNERELFIDPDELILPMNIKKDEIRLDWVKVSNLAFRHGNLSDADWVYMPKEAVLMPCPNRLWACNTNGIASGNSLIEALVHAILEVIERDAQSLAFVSREARQIGSYLRSDDKTASLIHSIESAGLEIFIKDITSDLEIPVFYSLIRDPISESPWFCSGGTGAHVNPHIAIVRSITEAVQARTCMIAGAREDLHKEKAKETISFQKFNNLFEFWFSNQGGTANDYQCPAFETMENLLEYLLATLNNHGFKIYWADLSQSNLPFKVVRAIIPGMECFVTNKTRIGKRLLQKEPNLEKLFSKKKGGD